MSEEEAIDILENIISDEVIGTYCIEIQKNGVNCSENCKDKDCYLVQAIETILDLYNKEKEKNEKLELENEELKREEAKRSWVHIKENGEVEPLFYISEDKIKAKIEELDLAIFKNQTIYTVNKMQEIKFARLCLAELLEKEK